MSYINEQLLKTVLVLDPKDLNSDIDNTIKYRLKENIEGKCHEDGYIIDGISVTVILTSKISTTIITIGPDG